MGILRFRHKQFSGTPKSSQKIFLSTKFVIQFYDKKFSKAPTFLCYFSDLENEVKTLRFSPLERASQNLYESQKKWKVIFWHVSPLSVDHVTNKENLKEDSRNYYKIWYKFLGECEVQRGVSSFADVNPHRRWQRRVFFDLYGILESTSFFVSVRWVANIYCKMFLRIRSADG